MHAYEAETESVRRNGAKPVTNEEAEKAMTARMKVLAVVMAVATAALASFAAMAQQTAQKSPHRSGHRQCDLSGCGAGDDRQ